MPGLPAVVPGRGDPVRQTLRKTHPLPAPGRQRQRPVPPLNGPSCPLCQAAGTLPLGRHRSTGYRLHRCPRCRLAFVDPADHPSPAAEAARYRLHRNRPDDEGYLRFLAPVLEAVRRTVPGGAHGLDFGSGPQPVLAALLTAAGYRVGCHDPLFAPDARSLAERYAFVVANEVIEHFREPAAAFALLARLPEPGGTLFLRSGRPPREPEAFLRWHYLSDPTHLAFYSPETIAWIATTHGLALLGEPDPGLWVLRQAQPAEPSQPCLGFSPPGLL